MIRVVIDPKIDVVPILTASGTVEKSFSTLGRTLAKMAQSTADPG
jgi:hypothetical protein